MAYTAPQIGTILLKADRTMYKIGQIAYENMFAEDNEALDYERDVIFIYKKAVEFADDFFVGTDKLDKVVERLAVKISAYDYGELNPIYADANTVNIATVVAGAALNDLTDVTITNLLDNQFLRYNAATGQWINVGPGAAVRNSQAFTATAGQTVFTTSYPFDSGLFDLYVNGVKLNSLSYTTMGEYQITLNDPCIVGDIVDVVIYDPSTSVSPAVGSLNDLTDVSIGPLANNQVLYYNAATGLWQNAILPSLIGYVPYSGATGDVSLGEYGINVGNVIYDTTPTGIPTEQGATYWDADAETVALIMNGTIQKIGEDTFYHVRNTTGSTIAKGTAVRFSGTTGNSGRLLIAPMLADGTYPSQYYMGITSEEIANNQDGKVYHFGKMRNINTSAFADGDVLYVSPSVAGALTATAPVAPNNIIVAAAVVHAANNGTLMIRTTLGSNINSDEGVLITTPTANQGLFYDSGLWVNKSITTALGYTPANAATTLTINGVTYDLSTSRTWTIAAGISGSGASGQVTYWTGSSAVSGSNTFAFTPTSQLFVNNSVTAASAIARGVNLTPTLVASANNDFLVGLDVNPTFNNGAFTGINNIVARFTGARGFLLVESSVNGNNTAVQLNAKTSTGTIVAAGFYNIPSGTNSNYFTISGDATGTHFNIHKSGNVVLQASGTPPDAGQRLQVYGDTLLRGSGNTSATTALTVQNSTPSQIFSITNDGATRFGGPNIGIYASADRGQTINTGAGGLYIGYYATGDLAYAVPSVTIGRPLNRLLSGTAGIQTMGSVVGNYSPTSGTGQFITFEVIPTINQTGGANGITRGLYVNPTLTSAADFRAIETTAGNVLFGSNFFWNNTNARLGIGIATPAVSLDVRTSAVGELAYFANTAANSGLIIGTQTNVGYISSISSLSALGFGINGATSGIRIFTNSNVAINSAADLGVRFGVVGDTLLRGSGATSATTALTVQNSDSTNMFRLNNAGQAMFGTNAQSAGVKLETDGVFRAWTNVQLGQFGTVTINTTQLTKGASGSDLFEIANSSAHNAIGGTYYALQVRNSVTPTSGNAIVNGLVLNLTINQTGGANGITRGLYVNPTLTAAADWRSIEWSNNSGWGLYGSGTAPSFFNGSVGIGTTATGNYNLRVTKNLTGSAIFFNVLSSGAIQSDVTTQAHYFRTGASSANATFTIPNLYHYTALQDSFGASSTITNQYGFFADLSITGATNNYGFYGNISSGTGRWNLYMSGTADNYLAGNLGIGITPTVRLHVSGDTLLRGSGATSATTALTVQNSSSTNLFTVRNDGITKFGTSTYFDVTSPLIIGRDGVATARITIANNGTYQDSILVNTSITSGNINTWSFGQRRDTAFGNTLGSFQIVGGYVDNTGAFSTVGGGYRVPLICNPNGDVLINGGNANVVNGLIGLKVNAPTAHVDITASTTANASLRIRSGTAPTTPNDGDIWFDGTDIKMRIGGVTKTFTLI